ncbi:hypothetical protein P7C70_g5212, partial [Phenoliferia sp. Uapishka_3]
MSTAIPSPPHSPSSSSSALSSPNLPDSFQNRLPLPYTHQSLTSIPILSQPTSPASSTRTSRSIWSSRPWSRTHASLGNFTKETPSPWFQSHTTRSETESDRTKDISSPWFVDATADRSQIDKPSSPRKAASTRTLHAGINFGNFELRAACLANTFNPHYWNLVSEQTLPTQWQIGPGSSSVSTIDAFSATAREVDASERASLLPLPTSEPRPRSREMNTMTSTLLPPFGHRSSYSSPPTPTPIEMGHVATANPTPHPHLQHQPRPFSGSSSLPLPPRFTSHTSPLAASTGYNRNLYREDADVEHLLLSAAHCEPSPSLKDAARTRELEQAEARERRKIVDKVLRRAQAAKLARTLRARLELATFKTSRGWETASLNDIEPHVEAEEMNRRRELDYRRHQQQQYELSQQQLQQQYMRASEPGLMGPPASTTTLKRQRGGSLASASMANTTMYDKQIYNPPAPCAAQAYHPHQPTASTSALQPPFHPNHQQHQQPTQFPSAPLPSTHRQKRRQTTASEMLPTFREEGSKSPPRRPASVGSPRSRNSGSRRSMSSIPVHPLATSAPATQPLSSSDPNFSSFVDAASVLSGLSRGPSDPALVEATPASSTSRPPLNPNTNP